MHFRKDRMQEYCKGNKTAETGFDRLPLLVFVQKQDYPWISRISSSNTGRLFWIIS